MKKSIPPPKKTYFEKKISQDNKRLRRVFKLKRPK